MSEGRRSEVSADFVDAMMAERKSNMSIDDEFNTTTFGELERDPSGKAASDAGAKLDDGKARMGLVLGSFARALVKVGEVGTFGAGKYSDNGWREVVNGEARYTDAMLRHYFDEAQGQMIDMDSGQLHAAQVAWNALARLELLLINRGGEGDAR